MIIIEKIEYDIVYYLFNNNTKLYFCNIRNLSHIRIFNTNLESNAFYDPHPNPLISKENPLISKGSKGFFIK